MTTVYDLGIYGIKKGMYFRNKESVTVLYYEITSELSQGFNAYYFDVTIHYNDDTTSLTRWFDYEISAITFISNYEFITEDINTYKPEEPKKTCWHTNKKKVILINTSGYWYCPDCKMDLGNLTEDEFYLAVKEQFGGKECKRAPEMNRWKAKPKRKTR